MPRTHPQSPLARRLVAAAAWTFALVWAGASTAEGPSFGAEVEPILSDKCFTCHGPDGENRQADLRLDVEESARPRIESGEVLRRIESRDEAEVMPPPDSKLSLTAAEKETLRRWLAVGSPYEPHWAFRPLPRRVAVPGAGRGWARRPLDHFIAAGHAEQGLSASPEAPPRRWLRRVSLDLTGLPPTVEELRAFEADLAVAGDPERVYELAAHRLLDSPAFGEHLAVAWLDVARYADSYGYQSDNLNTVWPYRDWVVRAINDNLPYDQFLTWQLAGDLLPDATTDQRLATAFHRLHRMTNEGGAIYEEWRLEGVADRVHTFGTAVLGLTLECARCHDHKYDPITSRDYYSLSAFLNSIDESGVYERTDKAPPPTLMLPTDEQARALRSAVRGVEQAERALADAQAAAPSRLGAWLRASGAGGVEAPGLRVALALDEPYCEAVEGLYRAVQLDRSPAPALGVVSAEDSPLPRLEARLAADTAATRRAARPASKQGAAEPARSESAPPGGGSDSPPPRRAIVLDGDRGVAIAGAPPFDRWTPWTVVISLRAGAPMSGSAVIAHHTRGTDIGYNGWDLRIVDGRLESRLYRAWPGNGIGVRTEESVSLDTWRQIAATYDGSSTARGLRVFVDGAEVSTEVLRDRIQKKASVGASSDGPRGGELVLGQRFRDRGLDGGEIDDVRVYDRDLTAGELHAIASGTAPPATEEFYTRAIDPAVRGAAAALTEARRLLVEAEEAVHETPVMEETPEPRTTHLLARGAYDAPTSDQTLVTRAAIAGIEPPIPPSAPRDRLGLAEWVTLPDHPLTARVAVNRLWANFFGVGLVATPDNFGHQGAPPTHPELLDWLARDFVDGGWDVKRLCRDIVLSASYRQDSRRRAVDAERDSENVWIARGPSHRLSAEQIRDLALSASGLLFTEIGGPPVSPYQPGGDLWRESNAMSPAYQQSVGRGLYRRSLYSVWKRTAPLPNMTAFDADSREVCVAKRARTNTPLQALVLRNDTQFVEASRVLAERLVEDEADAPARIDAAFERLAGRRAREAERAALARLYEEELGHYQADAADAARLLAVGDSEPNAGCEPAELAALTNVCRVILNLDATIWKR